MTRPATRDRLDASDTSLAQRFDVALLDLDGVVYVGQGAVSGARDHLLAARAQGMRLAYVTNNASRTPDVVAAHLRELGMPAQESDVVTSAQAAARVVAGLTEPGSRVLVVGGEGLIVALRERGLVPVTSADDDPAAVVSGFSPDLAWPLLAEGAYALERGVPWVASNTDLTVPTPRGRAPGNGTFVQVLRQATGRDPVVAGKPETSMHAESVERTAARAPLIVGDRLDTDIEGANRADVPSLLVLTGVTDAADVVLATEALRPAYLSDDLGGLHTRHPTTTATPEGFRCGSALARIDDGALSVVPDSPGAETITTTTDRLDPVRAACAAAWTYGVRRLDPDAVRRELAVVLR